MLKKIIDSLKLRKETITWLLIVAVGLLFYFIEDKSSDKMNEWDSAGRNVIALEKHVEALSKTIVKLPNKVNFGLKVHMKEMLDEIIIKIKDSEKRMMHKTDCKFELLIDNIKIENKELIKAAIINKSEDESVIIEIPYEAPSYLDEIGYGIGYGGDIFIPYYGKGFAYNIDTNCFEDSIIDADVRKKGNFLSRIFKRKNK